jgi:homoserine dehydrogenase
VDGFDTLFKLVIITIHAFGTFINHRNVFNTGISKINSVDISYAKEKRKKIKLIGQVLKHNENSLSIFVLPKLVSQNEYIFGVENEFNGVVIEGEFYDKQFMFGKGAGGFPTGSSVLSDITACSYNYRYEYKKRNYFKTPVYSTDINLKIYLRYNNLVDFSFFKFSEISERFSCENFNYVIGTINLTELLKIKDILKSLNVFIALCD